MIEITLFSFLVMSFAVFIAQFFKGFAGFGPALIAVPVLSLFFAPKDIIPLISLLNVIGGYYLGYKERKNFNLKLILPAMSGMVTGSIIGANLFILVNNVYLKKSLGFIIIAFSINLILYKGIQKKYIFHPKREFLAGTISGTVGGIFGISAPILVIYIKRYYTKLFFRTQMIFILMVSTTTRTIVYFLHKAFSTNLLIMALILLPALFAGILTGSKVTKKVNESLFNRIVASVLIIIGIKLII